MLGCRAVGVLIAVGVLQESLCYELQFLQMDLGGLVFALSLETGICTPNTG